MSDTKNIMGDYAISELSRKRWMIGGIFATVLIVLSVPVYMIRINAESMRRPVISAASGSPSFVGRDKCVECHQAEAELWTNSHHDKALELANDDTVLGDFKNVYFKQGNTTARFYRDRERFFVRTQGPDGGPDDFEVTHIIGTYPLQQYMVPFPGNRLQCLNIAWDVRKDEWYLLPDSTSDSADWLHWTKGGQNWNGMCAECHSTHLQKKYDPETDTYHTSWSEIDVSCEACHGPASQHVFWAEQPEMARKPADNYKLVVKTRDIDTTEQLEICARCHSRRTLIDDYDHANRDLMDAMIPQLLTEEIYHADGQIQHEVFVYGSFTQSKMFDRDVKCSNCHDVHSLKPKIEGNGLCLQCHRSEMYDSADHHFHQADHNGNPSDGNKCVSCHMPGKTYMGIDNRADHSIRIPRPDLSLTLGSPNACNQSGCHADKTNEWSAQTLTSWYGLRKRFHFGALLAAGRSGAPEAQEGLIKLADDQLYPSIVRATALGLLGQFSNVQTFEALERAISDPEALVRHAAASALGLLWFQKQTGLLAPLLHDPVRSVRLQAALALAEVGQQQLDARQKAVLKQVLLEYEQMTTYMMDLPSGRFNRGILYSVLGKPRLAIKNYQKAIEIDKQFFRASYNLAMLHNHLGNKEEAEKLLMGILESQPGLHEVAYSLGLLLVEQHRYNEAVSYLKNAADGLPGRSRILYNLGLLQQVLKRDRESLESLNKALKIEPESFDYLFAVTDFLVKRGRCNEAVPIARRLREKHPLNESGLALADYLARIQTERPRQSGAFDRDNQEVLCIN